MSPDIPKRPIDLLSIVIPIFNESAVLPELRIELERVLSTLNCRWEVLFVDDGSWDLSYNILSEWSQQEERIKIIRLSRNFGQQAAFTAGLDRALGDVVVTMDADLQDPPELIQEMVDHYQKGCDIVYAKRQRREGESWFKKATAYVFYRLLRHESAGLIPEDTGDFRLMSRPTVDILNQMRERHRFLRGMSAWVGFSQMAITFERPIRKQGKTKYSVKKMCTLAADAVFSFSILPLRISLLLGMVVFCFGVLYSIYSLIQKYCYADVVPGWTALVMLLSIIGGAILVCLGVIGEYIGRIYEEVKHRPLYIVRESRNLGAK
ncbi:MAG: glycosyltransferase family 2 protein [Verrucomicrobiales bacterium]|jgi:dolichol-phosphate mannosyltransferase|nr:glycosyltransferase family 2 protein [Verrucomicrobiales bacterium]